MKKPLIIIHLFFSVLLLSSCNGQNETPPPKEKITQQNPVEENLEELDPYFSGTTYPNSKYGPGSITRNILQDKNGYIWLATWDGIIRYDPSLKGTEKAFTNFTNKEKLRRFRVFCMLEDSKGYIWFGTIGAGLYRYDPSKSDDKAFTNFTTKDGLVYDGIGCLYEDKNDNIWIGTQNGISLYQPLFSKIDGAKKFQNFTTEHGLTNTDINSIVEDESGKLWIGSRGDARFYAPSNSLSKEKTFTKITTKDGMSFQNVRRIIKTKNGDMWLGGNNGIWRYDGISFTNLSKNFGGYIYEDKKGNIYTNTASDGNAQRWDFSRYDVESLSNKKPIATPVKTEDNMFFGITEDKEGGIWVGHLHGVFRYNPNLPLMLNKDTFDYFKSVE